MCHECRLHEKYGKKTVSTEAITLIYHGSKEKFDAIEFMFKSDQFKEIFDIPIESIKWEPRTIAGMIHKYDESLHEVLNIEEARARLKKKE